MNRRYFILIQLMMIIPSMEPLADNFISNSSLIFITFKQCRYFAKAYNNNILHSYYDKMCIV